MHPADVLSEQIKMVLVAAGWPMANNAFRTRNEIERILEFAKVRKLCTGDNPRAGKAISNICWPHQIAKSSAERLFPMRKCRHSSSGFVKNMTENRSVRFIGRWREYCRDYSNSRRLAGCDRPRRLADCSEFGEEDGLPVWKIPAQRMKRKEDPHWIPMSNRMIEIRDEMMQRFGSTGYLFKGNRPGKPVSAESMGWLLRRMGIKGQVDTHGFRSTFRDWGSEETHHEHNVLEMALQHKIKNEAEAAYRRGNLLKKRRILMQDWAHYCA